MYRIVKRIVRTITIITWSIRWEAGQQVREEQVALPPITSETEEEVHEIIRLPKKTDQEFNQTIRRKS
jgi:hypothetical protein